VARDREKLTYLVRAVHSRAITKTRGLHMVQSHALRITVGRVAVLFRLRADENLYADLHSAGWIAEYQCREVSGTRQAPLYETKWVRLGTYGSAEAAAKALYMERAEFSASYGCDAAAGVE
jgi:hypothetical protein